MRRFLLMSAAAAGLVVLMAAPALAHGEYDHGDIAIATGFQTEPAYVGQPKVVELEISKAGKPVTDVGQRDVKVGVSFGGQTTDDALEPIFVFREWGTPGDYIAYFIPTQPGKYTF